MGLALYRKYRPKTFKELVGQNHIKTTLESELASGKVAHAYLFSGPRGLGKTTTARLLAKAVNCLNRKDKQSEPCNQCESCQEIMDGKSLDVIEIDAASHTGVENVRENIIANSRFTPTSRQYKVFIIDEVHMLSLSAFNALLKTLEEPPAHAIFILATTEIHKVPETIISRCQHFDFRKVRKDELTRRLSEIISQEGKKLDKEVLENIAYFGAGSIRDAESLLGQILSLGEKEITAEQAELVLPRSRFDLVLELIKYLFKKDSSAALILINSLVEDGIDLEKFTDETIELLRKILLIKVSPALGQFSGSLSKEMEKNAGELAAKIPLDFLIKSIEIFISKRAQLKYADIIQLPLELAALEIIAPEKNDDSKDPGSPGQSSSQGDLKTRPAPSALAKPQIAKAEKILTPEIAPEKFTDKVKVNFIQIKARWHEVLNALKEHNHSLAGVLKIGQPAGINAEGKLEIEFKHEFHGRRINDVKNRKIIEDVLKDIFGLDLFVKTVIVSDLVDEKIEVGLAAEEKKDSGGVDDLLKTFGGQVIE